MTRVHVLTLKEPLVFTSRVEMGFLLERMELWTSFVSPRWLNVEFSSCVRDDLENLPLVLILVNLEGLGSLLPFNF